MNTAVADVTRWRFSTDSLPEHERGAALHALYGRDLIAAYETLPDIPVYADFTQLRLPGLGFLSGAVEGVRVERTRQHLADGIVDLCLVVNLGGGGAVRLGRGREVISHPGDAVLISCAEPNAGRRISPRERGRFFVLLLPRAALAPLVTNLDDAVLRLIPRGTGALKLLANYVGSLPSR